MGNLTLVAVLALVAIIIFLLNKINKLKVEAKDLAWKHLSSEARLALKELGEKPVANFIEDVSNLLYTSFNAKRAEKVISSNITISIHRLSKKPNAPMIITAMRKNDNGKQIKIIKTRTLVYYKDRLSTHAIVDIYNAILEIEKC